MASQVANKWKELLEEKVIDLLNDTFKIILLEPGFAFSRASHEKYADVSANELATGDGYTGGGVTLAGVTQTNDSVLAASIISWNNPSWLIGPGNVQASCAIIYDDTVAVPVVDPIVGCIDFEETIITYAGGTFTIANVAFGIR
jgi:hypothetical protein